MSPGLSPISALPFGEGGVGPDLGEQAIASLEGQPNFAAATLAAATAIVDIYQGNWWLNRLVNDRGRFILGLIIVDLHFDAADGPGFTPARLQEVAGATGVCSPGRITAFLASLRLLGFLRPVTSEDRRLRRLIPTERFLAAHRERWRRLLAALAMIDPEADAALAALSDPAFMGGFAHTLVGAYRSGRRVSQFVPELLAILERDAGLTMLLSLLIADAAGQPVSITALARRFAVSRAHVLTVLREAEQAGLAIVAGSRGGYRASPELARILRRLFAVMFLLHLHAIQNGRRAAGLVE